MKKLPLPMALCTTLSASETIHHGSKVYVTPTKDDFDRYLMAEIQKEEFAIVLVTKGEEAEFQIAMTSSSSKNEVSILLCLQIVTPMGMRQYRLLTSKREASFFPIRSTIERQREATNRLPRFVQSICKGHEKTLKEM